MRFKGTFVLLLMVILLGGYIYFYEYRGGAERAAAKRVENQIWRFDINDIVQVELITPEGTLIAERNTDQWMITSPQLWRAETSELDRLVSSAATLNRETMVEEQTTDLARFGLAPASLGLRMKTRDGKEYGIDFGINNPSGNLTYSTLVGENNVFLVSANAAFSFDRKIEEFRDRKIFRFERAGVQSVVLRNPSGTIELEKDRDDRWWFRGPEKREAGGPAVRELLNAMDLGSIAEFFNDNVNDYENASLDTPMIDVVLTFGADKAMKRLVIGPEKSILKKKPVNGVEGVEVKSADSSSPAPTIFLARDDSREELFFVEKTLVDKLSQSANDIRDKALISFQRWDVDSIILENSKGRFDFVKTDGDWLQQGSTRKANWEEINGILDALEKPVSEWIDNPSNLASYGVAEPSKPTLRIVLKKGSDIIAECIFGRSTQNGIYAKVSGDSSVKVANPEGLEFLDKSESDYLEPVPEKT